MLQVPSSAAPFGEDGADEGVKVSLTVTRPSRESKSPRLSVIGDVVSLAGV